MQRLPKRQYLIGSAMTLTAIAVAVAWAWKTQSPDRRLIGDLAGRVAHLSLLNYHAESLLSSQSSIPPRQHLPFPNTQSDELIAGLRVMDQDLLGHKFTWEILVPGTDTPIDRQITKTRLAQTDDERRIMQDLAARLADSMRQPIAQDGLSGAKLRDQIFQLDYDGSVYQYYQPVFWKDSCIVCHIASNGKFLPADKQPRAELRGPTRIIKLTISP